VTSHLKCIRLVTSKSPYINACRVDSNNLSFSFWCLRVHTTPEQYRADEYFVYIHRHWLRHVPTSIQSRSAQLSPNLTPLIFRSGYVMRIEVMVARLGDQRWSIGEMFHLLNRRRTDGTLCCCTRRYFHCPPAVVPFVRRLPTYLNLLFGYAREYRDPRPRYYIPSDFAGLYIGLPWRSARLLQIQNTRLLSVIRRFCLFD